MRNQHDQSFRPDSHQRATTNRYGDKNVFTVYTYIKERQSVIQPSLSMTLPLPKYNRPPVVEVALSMQFERLDLSTAQLGLVWQKFRDRFPEVQEQPELEPVYERFDGPKMSVPGVRFEVGKVPSPRLWFMDEKGNELVQIQRDRFVRNWRKTDDAPGYPSYGNLREAFVADWKLFSKFVADECNQEVLPDQCEITYVNVIDEVVSARLSDLVAWVGGSYSDDGLGDPEHAEFTLRFTLDDAEKPWGRLHVVTTPVVRASDGAPGIRLALTARGAPKTQDTEGAMEILDKEHEAIVRGFTSLTTPEMHEAWERKQ